MNDMVSIRKIRPGADVLSSTHAGVAVETLLGTSLSAADAARVLAIDALERGDNRSSLAAATRAKTPCGSPLSRTSCRPGESRCGRSDDSGRGDVWSAQAGHCSRPPG